MPSPDERPIFVLSSGWRSGSTLLQRLLCSHPEVMVWGENRGLFERLRAAHETLGTLRHFSDKHGSRYAESAHQAWIPLLNPPADGLERGLRELLLRYYADATRARGRSLWGVKEVRDDADVARFLRRLFPEARVLFLTRHPTACLASARATTKGERGLLVEAGGSRAFLEHWRRLVASFLAADDVPHLLVPYERMIEEPQAWTARIAGHLELDEGDFDPEVFGVRLRGWKREPFLSREDRRALERRELWEVAARCGYAPEDGERASLLRRWFGAGAS